MQTQQIDSQHEATVRQLRRFSSDPLALKSLADFLMANQENRVSSYEIKSPSDTSVVFKRWAGVGRPAEEVCTSREEELRDLARWTLGDIDLDWEHAENVGELAWGESDH
jgi:hypothetical protein